MVPFEIRLSFHLTAQTMKTQVFTAALLLATAMTLTAPANDLAPKDRALARAAAFAAKGNLTALKAALADGLDEGLSVSECRETLVQAYAYCGFPRSLNALGTFMELMSERGNRDKPGAEPNPPPPGRPIDFGTTNQTRLCGAPVTGPLFEFAPAIDEYLKAHLFGDIFSRGILDWRTREIVTVAMLAARDGLEPQLNAHIAIAKRNGVSVEQIDEILAIVRDEVNGGENTSPFPLGAPNDAFAKYFTGRSYLAPVTTDPSLGIPVFNVTFEPGCRNNWHKHSQGQLLIVVGGVGWYQARGEKPRRLKTGDVVEIHPNVEHWHGADPNHWFAHLAIEGNPGKSNQNTWLEPVSDADYEAATK